jgi:hypothetical protein
MLELLIHEATTRILRRERNGVLFSGGNSKTWMWYGDPFLVERSPYEGA